MYSGLTDTVDRTTLVLSLLISIPNSYTSYCGYSIVYFLHVFMMGTSEDCSNYLQIKIKGKKRANKRIGACPSCSLKEKKIEAQHINVKVAWHCCYARHIYLLLKIHIRTHTYLNLWIQNIGYIHQTQKLFRDDDRINLTGLQRYKAVICWSEREMDIYWDGQTSPFMSVELKRLGTFKI